jgi:hypothetical protein
MAKKKHYDINTPEEFIAAWMKITPQISAKAKQLNITLENADGTPMDSSMLFLTGETTTDTSQQFIAHSILVADAPAGLRESLQIVPLHSH